MFLRKSITAISPPHTTKQYFIFTPILLTLTQVKFVYKQQGLYIKIPRLVRVCFRNEIQMCAYVNTGKILQLFSPQLMQVLSPNSKDCILKGAGESKALFSKSKFRLKKQTNKETFFAKAFSYTRKQIFNTQLRLLQQEIQVYFGQAAYFVKLKKMKIYIFRQ